MRGKSWGTAQGLANARPSGSVKFVNAPLPGSTDNACKCPVVAWTGGGGGELGAAGIDCA